MEKLEITKERFENLGMLGKAAVLAWLTHEGGYSQRRLEGILGISARQIRRYLALHEAPEKLKAEVEAGVRSLATLDGLADQEADPEVSSPSIVDILDGVRENLDDGTPPPSSPPPSPPSGAAPGTPFPSAESVPGALPAFFQPRSFRATPVAGAFDVIFQAYQDFIGYYNVPHVDPPPEWGTELKIAVINDLHVPFHDNDAFREFVQREKDWADLVFVAGDLLDLFCWSSFTKRQQAYTPREEFQIGQSVLNTLAANFKEVLLLPGNHDERMYRYLLRNSVEGGNLDFLKLVLESQGATLDVLQAMSYSLPNVKVVEPKKIDYADHGYMHQIGDLILGHPEVYSQIPGRPVENFIKWLRTVAQPNGIVDEFNVVGIGHTHSYSQIRTFGAWGFEMGCLCPYQEYTANPKLKTKREWNKGYTRFVQYDGVTDINQSGFISLGDEPLVSAELEAA